MRKMRNYNNLPYYRESFLDNFTVETFRDACKKASQMPWKKRGVFEEIVRVDLEIPRDWSRCYNSGDYYRYVDLVPTSQRGVFRLREDWSADWDIADYRLYDDYVVLSKDDIFRLMHASVAGMEEEEEV